MILSNITYAVVYVDPSIGTAGDGSTPDAALANLPATPADATCYLIRRTAEASFCTLAGATGTQVNLALWGMPKSTDDEWAIVPEAAKTAWGSDVADRANIKFTTPGTALTLAAIKNFSMLRIYAFREVAASPNAFMLNFTGTGGDNSIRFSRCKFGAQGIDIDNPEYNLLVSSQALRMYVKTSSGRVFSLENSIINAGHFTSTGNCIQLGATDYIQVADCAIFVLSASVSYVGQQVIYIPDNTAPSRLDVCNLAIDVIPNAANAAMPVVFRSGATTAAIVSGITVTMSRIMTGSTLTSLTSQAPLVAFESVGSFSLTDFTANLPYLWRCLAAGSVLLVTGSSIATGAAPERRINGINVQTAAAAGIGIGADIAWVQPSVTYSAVSVDFSLSLYGSGCMAVPALSDVTIYHPRGIALYANNVELSDCSFIGAVRLKSAKAAISVISSWYPCNALIIDGFTTATVETITINEVNGDYPYTGLAAVVSTDKYAVAYVDYCNVPLQPNTAGTTTTIPNLYTVICGNEGTNGHFSQRSQNCICDTWTVYRQGGAAASLKLYNNAAAAATSLLLGQHPFAGIRLVPTTSGKHILTVYLATKISDLSELGQRFIVMADVPTAAGRRLYYSNIHGQVVDDASYWLNDEGLTIKKIQIPVTIEKTGTQNPVDVKFDFRWYTPDGFLYIDPQVELTAAE